MTRKQRKMSKGFNFFCSRIPTSLCLSADTMTCMDCTEKSNNTFLDEIPSAVVKTI